MERHILDDLPDPDILRALVAAEQAAEWLDLPDLPLATAANSEVTRDDIEAMHRSVTPPSEPA